MSRYDNLITSRSARLPGDYAPLTEAEWRIFACDKCRQMDCPRASDRRKKCVFCPVGVAEASKVIPVVKTAPRSSGAILGAGMGELRLEIGFSPSINSYWQLGVNPKTRQRLLKVSAAGKAFTARTKHLVRAQFPYAPIEAPVAVLLELWAPTSGPYGNFGYDVDNRIKPTLDALTKAGVWADDKFVRDIRCVDRGRCEGGKCIVWVRPL